jgi:hypothetical protein
VTRIHAAKLDPLVPMLGAHQIVGFIERDNLMTLLPGHVLVLATQTQSDTRAIGAHKLCRERVILTHHAKNRLCRGLLSDLRRIEGDASVDVHGAVHCINDGQLRLEKYIMSY